MSINTYYARVVGWQWWWWWWGVCVSWASRTLVREASPFAPGGASSAATRRAAGRSICSHTGASQHMHTAPCPAAAAARESGQCPACAASPPTRRLARPTHIIAIHVAQLRLPLLDLRGPTARLRRGSGVVQPAAAKPRHFRGNLLVRTTPQSRVPGFPGTTRTNPRA